jgi:hypothetical protein
MIKKEVPRENSLFGLEDGSRNDFGEEFLVEEKDDLFFDG